MGGAYRKELPALLIASVVVAPFWVATTPAGSSTSDQFAKSSRIERVDAYCARKGAKKGRIYLEARVVYSDVRESLDPTYSGQTQSLKAKFTLSTRGGRRLARLSGPFRKYGDVLPSENRAGRGRREAAYPIRFLRRKAVGRAAHSFPEGYFGPTEDKGQRGFAAGNTLLYLRTGPLRSKGRGKTVITDEDSFEHTHRVILSRGISKRVLRRVHGTTACTKRHKPNAKLKVKVQATQTLKSGATGSATEPGRHMAVSPSQVVSKTVTRRLKTVPEADRLISGCPISPRTKCTAADLTNAKLNKTDLRNAGLAAADLSGANLVDAALNEVNLFNADLTGADLTNAVAYRANLTNANLTNANLTIGNFTEATLVNASLTGANLNDADLTSADLSGADLSGADLASADLSGTDLSGANLGGATCNDETVWPDETAQHGTLCP